MAVYNVNWIKEVGKESRNWGGGGIFSLSGGRKNGPVKWKKRRR